MDRITERPLANIAVIVIGAGIGGLSSAIELGRRGARVEVFESSPNMDNQGDSIFLGSSACSVIKKWGNVLDQLRNDAVLPDSMAIQDQAGKLLYNQPWVKEFNGNPSFLPCRGVAQKSIYDYALSLDVKVNFGSEVTQVFEDIDSAGVKVGGKTYKGDLVIASDGVHSKVRSFVTGEEDHPKKSGYATYRNWFSLDALENNPATVEIARANEPICKIWLGEITHAMLLTNTKLRMAALFVNHKDLADIKEDWNLAGDIKNMAQCVEGWDPILSEIIKQIPPSSVRDHKLLWRDPVPQWVSSNGRICLLGDSAHPHLPTAGNGAVQAIEDSATLAALLERCGKKDILLALKAYVRLRFERTSLTQRMGWENRHAWHHVDWKAAQENPELLKFPLPSWLHGSEPEKYVEEKFDEAISHLKYQRPFKSTNLPKDYVHEDWTIEQLLGHEGNMVNREFYRARAK